MGLVHRLLRRDDTQLKLLLLCTVIANVGFAFPRLVWATCIGYSLIALLLTQVRDRQRGLRLSPLGVGDLHRLQPDCIAAHPGDGGEQQPSELE